MQFQYTFYTQSFSTMYDVVSHMQQLETKLQNTDLQNLSAFNTTYLIITQAVVAKLNTQFFDNDRRMEQLDIIFARYYFDALYAYAHGNKCAPAWKLLFDACKQNTLYQWQYMALGVNAHVNNDLAFTLYDANFRNDYSNDYLKINNILSEKVTKVIESLHDRGILRSLYSPKVSITYSPILIFIIKYWRKNAWSNYQKLRVHPKYQTSIIQKAAQIAWYFGAR